MAAAKLPHISSSTVPNAGVIVFPTHTATVQGKMSQTDHTFPLFHPPTKAMGNLMVFELHYCREFYYRHHDRDCESTLMEITMMDIPRSVLLEATYNFN